MPSFTSYDGAELAFHVDGDGPAIVCLPGGPMQASAYLDDLGGLSAHRSLLLLDLRGTGASELPAQPASYRCDRLVDGVEPLRAFGVTAAHVVPLAIRVREIAGLVHCSPRRS